jgi:hypothetical protein
VNPIFEKQTETYPTKRLDVSKVGEDYRFVLSDENGTHEIVLDSLAATLLMMRLMQHVHDKPKESRHESIS